MAKRLTFSPINVQRYGTLTRPMAPHLVQAERASHVLGRNDLQPTAASLDLLPRRRSLRPNLTMDPQNQSTVTEFILLGLSSSTELQPIIFMLILTMYLINLAGNSLIVTVAWTDPKLKTPMYFLLSQLSCVDMAFSSITVPQFLVHIFSKHKAIPYGSCFVQMAFFLAVGNMEGYVLATMAYDRYVAVCMPLHYAAVMTQELCMRMMVGSWVLVTLHGALHGIRLSVASYCNNRILHFFCDIPFLVSLACPKPFLNDPVVFTEGISVVVSPFLFILASYTRIGATVIRLHSAEGLRKAVSTCGSHVLVVTLFYGTVIRLYFQPPGHSSLEQDRRVAVFYTVVSPMLNPLIYSLRNLLLLLLMMALLNTHTSFEFSES
ncbi:olfactory receptor 1J2-like [Tachyglossus aculeatus]|uniref:olfactory receptor 1J2-like n=1 Tax=Tachyglossus aculeatus TaxID=9261 RepID=UPI0018F456BD|nr:olfactory receptor 1J2-like [Tachyglossus aculeatus]